MTEWHEFGRAITTIGVVWAIVFGIVRIVNGPVATALLRIFDLREDQPLGHGTADTLEASITSLESRLAVLERERVPNYRLPAPAGGFAAEPPGADPEHGHRPERGAHVSDPRPERT